MKILIDDLRAAALLHRRRLIGVAAAIVVAVLALRSGLAAAQQSPIGVGSVLAPAVFLTTLLCFAPTALRLDQSATTLSHVLRRVLFLGTCAGVLALLTAGLAALCDALSRSSGVVPVLPTSLHGWQVYALALGIGLWVMAASCWLPRIFTVPVACVSLWAAVSVGAAVLATEPEVVLQRASTNAPWSLIRWVHHWVALLPTDVICVLFPVASLAAVVHSAGVLRRSDPGPLVRLLRGVVQTGLLVLATWATSWWVIQERAEFDPQRHEIHDVWWDPDEKRAYFNAPGPMAFEIDLVGARITKVGGPTELGHFTTPYSSWGHGTHPNTTLLAYQTYTPDRNIPPKQPLFATEFLVATGTGQRLPPDDPAVRRIGPMADHEGRQWWIDGDTLVVLDGGNRHELPWSEHREFRGRCGFGFYYFDPTVSDQDEQWRVYDLQRRRDYRRHFGGVMWVLPDRWLLIERDGAHAAQPRRRLFDPESGSFTPALNLAPDERVFAMFADGSVLLRRGDSGRSKPEIHRVDPRTGKRREVPTPAWVATQRLLTFTEPITGRFLVPAGFHSVMVLDPGSEAFRGPLRAPYPWTVACFDVGSADALTGLDRDRTALVRFSLHQSAAPELRHQIGSAAPVR